MLLATIYGKGQDTIYYNKKWEPTEKKRFSYYRVVQFKDSLYHVTDCYQQGTLQMTGQYSDQELKIPVGKFIWMGMNADTVSIRIYANGLNTCVILFEEGRREYRAQFINDSTTLTNNYLAGKYEIEKRLFVGKREYHYRGDEPVLNTKLFRYAFKKDWPYTNVIAIKGKAIPWFIIEEVGMVYSLGVEYTFHLKHSLELQATYFDHEHDAEDINGDPVPTTYTIRRSVQLGYKFYFKPWKGMDEDVRKFYVSPFLRYSKWHDYYEKGSYSPFTRNETWNYSTGIVAGYCIATGDRSYLDFFAGPQLVQRHNESTQTVNNNEIYQTIDKTLVNARIGFNFSYLLFRKSKTQNK